MKTIVYVLLLLFLSGCGLGKSMLNDLKGYGQFLDDKVNGQEYSGYDTSAFDDTRNSQTTSSQPAASKQTKKTLAPSDVDLNIPTGKALLRQLRHNLGALRIGTIRTEVAWDDLELLAFLKTEGFTPADRLCLECSLDPTAPGD